MNSFLAIERISRKWGVGGSVFEDSDRLSIKMSIDNNLASMLRIERYVDLFMDTTDKALWLYGVTDDMPVMPMQQFEEGSQGCIQIEQSLRDKFIKVAPFEIFSSANPDSWAGTPDRCDLISRIIIERSSGQYSMLDPMADVIFEPSVEQICAALRNCLLEAEGLPAKRLILTAFGSTEHPVKIEAIKSARYFLGVRDIMVALKDIVRLEPNDDVRRQVLKTLSVQVGIADVREIVACFLFDKVAEIRTDAARLLLPWKNESSIALGMSVYVFDHDYHIDPDVKSKIDDKTLKLGTGILFSVLLKEDILDHRLLAAASRSSCFAKGQAINGYISLIDKAIKKARRLGERQGYTELAAIIGSLIYWDGNFEDVLQQKLIALAESEICRRPPVSRAFVRSINNYSNCDKQAIFSAMNCNPSFLSQKKLLRDLKVLFESEAIEG